jgi:hypothetical protein
VQITYDLNMTRQKLTIRENGFAADGAQWRQSRSRFLSEVATIFPGERQNCRALFNRQTTQDKKQPKFKTAAINGKKTHAIESFCLPTVCVVVCCVADPLLFLGGDEVHNSCYSADNSTAEYVKEHHLEPPAMVDLFWQNVQADVRTVLVPLAQDCYALRCTHTVRVYVCVHVCGCGHQVWPNVSAGKRTLGVWVSDMPVRNVHTQLVLNHYTRCQSSPDLIPWAGCCCYSAHVGSRRLLQWHSAVPCLTNQHL